MKWINKSIIDLRAKPSTRSERVSQALFGTAVNVRQSKDDWCLIETPDRYQGFVETKHLSVPFPPAGPAWKVTEAIVPVRDPATDQVLTRFAFDTRFCAEFDGDRLILLLPTDEKGYVPRDVAIATQSTLDEEQLEQLARSFVGTPYLWGGVSSFGFDCSGFVQRLFHYCFNEWLPRDTAAQRRIGEPIALEDMKRGDLCFFPDHVALYIGEGRIVHANRHHNGVSVNRLLQPTDPYGEQLLKDFQEARRFPFITSPA